jgi:PhnB protein
MHGSLRIGDSVVLISDASTDYSAFPIWLHVYVPDVDATYRLALQNSATSVKEPSKRGDGDRRRGVKDHAGNTWRTLANSVPEPKVELRLRRSPITSD